MARRVTRSWPTRSLQSFEVVMPRFPGKTKNRNGNLQQATSQKRVQESLTCRVVIHRTRCIRTEKDWGKVFREHPEGLPLLCFDPLHCDRGWSEICDKPIANLPSVGATSVTPKPKKPRGPGKAMERRVTRLFFSPFLFSLKTKKKIPQ